jgi:hypothetical protein
MGGILVELRSAFLDCLLRIEDGREVFIFHKDALQGLRGRLLIRGRYGSDFISLIPDPICSEDGHIRPPLPKAVDYGRHILRRDDGLYARNL